MTIKEIRVQLKALSANTPTCACRNSCSIFRSSPKLNVVFEGKEVEEYLDGFKNFAKEVIAFPFTLTVENLHERQKQQLLSKGDRDLYP